MPESPPPIQSAVADLIYALTTIGVVAVIVITCVKWRECNVACDAWQTHYINCDTPGCKARMDETRPSTCQLPK
jgi:hypothetical protein